VIVPGTPSDSPANGPIVETAGIEPAYHYRQNAVTVVLVPLRDNWGEPRAYALIDPDDADRVAAYRWHLRNAEGYVATAIGRSSLSLHRFIWRDQVPDGLVVDHINGWRLDNRRANLRLVTTAQNAQNQGSRGGSSKHRGVTWDKARGLWMATAQLNGKRTTIGRFVTEDEAAKAAVAWRAEHMPFSGEAA
jgi:hypothetical protein